MVEEAKEAITFEYTSPLLGAENLIQRCYLGSFEAPGESVIPCCLENFQSLPSSLK